MFAFIFKSLALAKCFLTKASKQESFAVQKLYSQARL